MSERKVPNEEGKENSLEKVCKPSLASEVELSPSKQSVKFKCQIRFEIAKKFGKKCLDAFSL